MKETANLVFDFLNNMATKLTPMAKHVYEVYIRQTYTLGVVWLIVSAIVLLVSVLFTWLAVKLWKDNEIEGSLWMWFFTLIAIGVVIGFFINGFLHLSNPEYYVIQKLIEAIH